MDWIPVEKKSSFSLRVGGSEGKIELGIKIMNERICE